MMSEEELGGLAQAEMSEEAQSELIELCEQQFAQLEKLQNKIILCESDCSDNPQEQSVNRLMATEAELKQWLSTQPELLAKHSEVLLQAGKAEMLKLCSELEMVFACYEARRDKLRETKACEEEWLNNKTQALRAATNHVERLKTERENLSVQSVLKDTKLKIEKMKTYEEGLMECLGNLLEQHIPHPQNGATTNKKKNAYTEPQEDVISLSEMLEQLMNKILSTPHDPYVTIDNTFWPPYVEMLLRHGIAVRHHENNFKIRLEAFY